MAYADRAALAAYLYVDVTTLTSDDDRLLDRAADLLDVFVVNCDPTNSDQAAALSKASCAQVEWWRRNGETEVNPSLKARIVGHTRAYFRDDDSEGAFNDLCPRARKVLQIAGLLYCGVNAR
jgi:hypothetical protein